MPMPAGVTVRAMRREDVPAGLALCRAAGWNQTEDDWLHFLEAFPGGVLAAVENGLVIGTVAVLPYGPFAWISMVLVDPGSRGRGIGTLLLERGLEAVPAGSTARLDATPAGEVLYRRLGFAAEYELRRWFLDARPPGLARRTGVRPLSEDDWTAILAIDRRAFGAGRADLLRRLARVAPAYAWIAERSGELKGYLFGRHGRLREQLGPLVADSAETAGALVDTCLAANPGRSVFIDVPDDQRQWCESLVRTGFAIERPFLRMSRGPHGAAGEPSRVFAIAGPELG